MYRFTLTLLLQLAICKGYSQGIFFISGATSQSMANATVASSGPEASLNNPAGISGTNTLIASSFQTRFGIPGLNAGCIFGIIPIKRITTALILNRYGNKTYNEQAISLAAAHTIDEISLGVKVSLLQFQGSDEFNRKSIVTEFGGLIRLSKTLHLGAYIYNLNQAKIHSSELTFKLPVVMRAGINYQPIRKVEIAAEFYKDLLTVSSVRVGVSYHIINWLDIRAGACPDKREVSFGLGIKSKVYHLDYAFSQHLFIGGLHQFSLLLNIKENSK